MIELCDARVPASSRNPDLRNLAERKRHILFLNKADLADPAVTAQWIEAFRQEGTDAWAISSLKMKIKETLEVIRQATREIVQKGEERGIHRTVRAMILGVPNVGKSSLINRLHGAKVARAEDRPGVTRASQWVRVTPYLELLDTPGMLWPRLDDQNAAKRLGYIGTIHDEVVDLNSLALSLLEDLCDAAPEKTADRFHLDDVDLRGIDLMDAVCHGRGWLLKGNRCDYDRCSRVVLDEFRAGKLGRISLEKPGNREMKEHDRSEGKS